MRQSQSSRHPSQRFERISDCENRETVTREFQSWLYSALVFCVTNLLFLFFFYTPKQNPRPLIRLFVSPCSRSKCSPAPPYELKTVWQFLSFSFCSIVHHHCLKYSLSVSLTVLKHKSQLKVLSIQEFLAHVIGCGSRTTNRHRLLSTYYSLWLFISMKLLSSAVTVALTVPPPLNVSLSPTTWRQWPLTEVVGGCPANGNRNGDGNCIVPTMSI